MVMCGTRRRTIRLTAAISSPYDVRMKASATEGNG